MSHRDLVEYNLRDGGQEFTEFEVGQPDRVTKARAIITKILHDCPVRASIVEPGCSTGDISGFFARQPEVTVLGIDVTPGAAALARQKWPAMAVVEADLERYAPLDCDILVLTEILEHLSHPVSFVRAWLPHAEYVVIGHPLVGDGQDPERGHPWAYYDVDFANWFEEGGFELREAWEFDMGYRMAIGWGQRR